MIIENIYKKNNYTSTIINSICVENKEKLKDFITF